MPRNKFLLLLFVVCLVNAKAQLPFKYDNTVYKAIYLNEAFRLMESSPNYLLLDVRSPGEFADTSRATALNIGRFKGAINISIDSVQAHLPELKKYLDQPIFIYCSHSQRSRRVSKLLGENGFKQVYNINGGMSVVNESDAKTFIYKNKVLETNTSYTNIASTDAINFITNTPNLLIIDIRTEKEFASKDSLQQNNIGHLKNAINIPQKNFAEKFDSYKIPNNRPVLLYDLQGYNSMDLGDILNAKGFPVQYNLFEGLATFSADHHLTDKQRQQLIEDGPAYKLLDPKGTIDLLNSNPGIIVLDTRTAEEFQNKAERAYLNLGHIKGAINVPSLEALEKITTQKSPSTQFLIYGSGNNFGAIVCQQLIKKGFSNVYLLARPLNNFVWSTANVEDCKKGRELMLDYEGLY